MSMKIQIAFNGAAGRMGQRLVAMGSADHALKIVAGVDWAKSPAQGKDIGDLAGVGTLGVPLTAEIPPEVRVDTLIDFSTPEGTMSILKTCIDRKIPLVVATTGHTLEHTQEILAAAHQIPVLFSPNRSLVVNVLFELTRVASRVLRDKGFDVEIIERHHRFKKDSPSGTALQFARIVQEEMGQTHLQHGREGLLGERPSHEIGVHAVRGGDNVGEHTVVFTTLGETLELVHKGHSRDSYALGALAAAKFLVAKRAGSYKMEDVLGIGE